MGIKKKRKWTVFFLVKSVDGTIRQLIAMMNEIRSLDFTDEIAIVFCIHTVKESVPALLEGNTDMLMKDEAHKTFTTLFIELEPDPGNKDFPNKLRHVDTNDDFDLSVPDQISNYFRSIILDQFRAKRYMVFTWDHGNAFGIFTKIKRVQEFRDDTAAKSMATGVDAFELVEKEVTTPPANNLLTMDELAMAIQLAFGERRVDIVAMMNCHMQVIDTGYALRDTVNYLVASEMLLDIFGYNYPFIFQMMIDDPGISPKKLSKLIVSSLAKKVFPNRDLGQTAKGFSAVSAADLFYYHNLEKHINMLAEFLINQLPGKKEAILRARAIATVQSEKELVDLYTFVETLAKEEHFKSNPLIASLLLSMKDIIFFKTHIGDEFGATSNYKPTGLSIYFPDTVVPETQKQPISQRTSFFTKTLWKNFLINLQQAPLQPPQ
jgi:hypothetical protein